jgi:PAT family acetyl-CoA transporter-like MFS transporter 1
MYAGSFLIEGWLGGNGSSMDVLSATIYFFSLYFLMATQDIAVDGWALTMLSKESVGYASICNSIGQTLGVLFSNQGFIAFSDATWCQRYLGFEDGATLVTLPGFIRFWSYVFLLITFLVAILKTERKDQEGDEIPSGILETYSQVFKIIGKRPVRLLALVLLTCKVTIISIAIFIDYCKIR